MTLINGACSNPACHKPFQVLGKPDQYDIVIVRIEYPTKRPENRVVSLCKECKSTITKAMVENATRDVLARLIEVDENRLKTKEFKETEKNELMYAKVVDFSLDADEHEKKYKQ